MSVSLTAARREKMTINTKKIMKKASNASAGLAVVVAFLNTALLVVKLVQTVNEEAPKLDKGEQEIEG